MAIIGPALGYVVGGELLKLYTDFITVDPSEWVWIQIFITYNSYTSVICMAFMHVHNECYARFSKQFIR